MYHKLSKIWQRSYIWGPAVTDQNGMHKEVYSGLSLGTRATNQ